MLLSAGSSFGYKYIRGVSRQRRRQGNPLTAFVRPFVFGFYPRAADVFSVCTRVAYICVRVYQLQWPSTPEEPLYYFRFFRFLFPPLFNSLLLFLSFSFCCRHFSGVVIRPVPRGVLAIRPAVSRRSACRVLSPCPSVPPSVKTEA